MSLPRIVHHRPHPVCVVTHHKTGTVWMRNVFSAIAHELNLPMFAQLTDPADPKVQDFLSGPPGILFINTGAKPAYLDAADHVMIVHVIRDPRDVLISGLDYHLRHEPRPGSPEASIHSPREEWDGQTYQQKLHSLPSRAAQLKFEMHHRHARTLKQMLRWDYDDPRHVEWRYEEMMTDTNLTRFALGLGRAGWRGEPLAVMCRQFWAESLFGGRAPKSRQPDHVGSGAVTRWRRELPRAVAELYVQRYGDALVSLGYEAGTDWPATLATQPDTESAEDRSWTS